MLRIYFLVVLSVLFVTACSSDSGPKGISLGSSSVSLSVVRNGDLPSAAHVSINWTGNDVAQVVVGVPAGQSLPGWMTIDLLGNYSPLDLVIGVNTTTLSPGTYNATVRVAAGTISDELINYVDLPVSYTVLPELTVSPASLNFSVFEAQYPADQTVTLNTLTNVSNVSANIYFGPTVSSSPLDVAQVNNTFTVSANASALNLMPGVYNGMLSIYLQYNNTIAKVFDIPISYEVKSLLVVPGSVAFNISGVSQVADLQQSYVPSSPLGDVSWNASVDVDWLAVSASGTTGTSDPLDLTIQQASLAGLGVGTHQATITLTGLNFSNAQIPVTLNISLPTIDVAAPYVNFANQNNKLLVRGLNFDNFVGNVLVDGSPANKITNISNTELEIEFTPTTTGLHDIAMENLGVTSSKPNIIEVVEPGVFPGETITLTEAAAHLAFDPIHNTLFFAANSGLHKLQYDSVNGWMETSTSIPFIAGISLSNDGNTLYATYASAYDNRLYVVNTADLSYSGYTQVSTFYDYYRLPLTLNDGNVLLIDTDQWSGTYLYPSGSLGLPSIYAAIAKISGNGEKIIYGARSTIASAVYIYDVGDAQYTVSSIPSGYLSQNQLAISEHMEKLIIGQAVYDQSFSNMGSVDPYDIVTLSPDGQLAYLISGNTLTTVDVSTSASPFPVVGTPVQYSTTTSTAIPYLVVSPDGGTLFILRGTELVVYPL